MEKAEQKAVEEIQKYIHLARKIYDTDGFPGAFISALHNDHWDEFRKTLPERLDLSGAHFKGGVFANIKFVDVNLQNCVFEDCIILGGWWGENDLSGSEFRNCDIKAARFNDAILSNSSFVDSKVSIICPRVKFSKASFKNCEFDIVVGLESALFNWAVFESCSIKYGKILKKSSINSILSAEQRQGIELIQESGASGCFIATAAFGTPLAEEVRVLSVFRDTYLLKSHLGRIFVNTYYTLSPPIAEKLKKSSSLCALVRKLIRALINICNKYCYR